MQYLRHTCTENYSLFICNSSLTGCPLCYLATLPSKETRMASFTHHPSPLPPYSDNPLALGFSFIYHTGFHALKQNLLCGRANERYERSKKQVYRKTKTRLSCLQLVLNSEFDECFENGLDFKYFKMLLICIYIVKQNFIKNLNRLKITKDWTLG